MFTKQETYSYGPESVLERTETGGTRNRAASAVSERSSNAAFGTRSAGSDRATAKAARRLAQVRGWPFNWRLVTAEGIGHSGGKMMRSPEMLDAMGLGAASTDE